MSALEPGLLAQLQDAAPLSVVKALERIATLCRKAEFIQSREVRIFRVALEGLGVPPAERDLEVQAVIQAKRDRVMARRAAEGDDDAAT